MKRFTLIIAMLFAFSAYAKAQHTKIEGTVYAFNKYPLKNVKITAKKTKKTTQTDANGRFAIEIENKDQIILQADAFEKFIYRPKKDQKSMRVNLIFENKKKNKEIAIQGGYISREHLDYGLRNLANENNIYSNFTDIFDAVIYAIPAAKVIIENGVRKIQLRGVKSTSGSNAALTVVNGYLSDDISYIIPSSIVSIKQLSPTATAIYGTGSANGVIEIKIKCNSSDLI
jgi:hypothetical protein